MVLLDTYCIYLRKSRADAEAEARGEGETLARHEHTLCDLAKRQKLHISKIYREIVSGETIAARPQMQQLLQDVESGIYAGVLVMEVERLARGDTIDQGIVAQAFKYSGTKIVTPTKTYNPDNEFDEEYFEFSLFMSRREYKTIKRRMQAGRAAAAKEANAKALSDATSQIAVAGAQRKDQIEGQYRERQQQLDEKLRELEADKVDGFGMVSNAIGGAVNGFASGLDLAKELGKN